LTRRAAVILLIIVFLAVVAAAIAIVYGLRATGTPSGAVTDPADVASQYAKYIVRKHPERGPASRGPAPCVLGHRKLTFDGYPVFQCFSPQLKFTPGTTSTPPDCVASTKHGIVTPEDGKTGWPKVCTTIRLP
jgi:hypothetical protein